MNGEISEVKNNREPGVSRKGTFLTFSGNFWDSLFFIISNLFQYEHYFLKPRH
jgi:hypothetical protein